MFGYAVCCDLLGVVVLCSFRWINVLKLSHNADRTFIDGTMEVCSLEVLEEKTGSESVNMLGTIC